MLETVVALAVFATAATMSLAMILQTTKVSSDNIRRTAAINLVSQRIEALRATAVTSIPDGLQVLTQTVGGTTYTLRQNANYLTSGSTASVCSSSGSTLAYKLITVTATWPQMGTVAPVKADTLKSVGVGSSGLDQSSRGTLAVLVSGALGTPTAGITLTLSPGGATRVTGDDGCAVFTGLTPGTYAATAATSGYTGVANTRSSTLGSLGVVAADIRRGTLLYDTARSVQVLLDAPGSAVVPSGLALRLGDVYLPEATVPTCPGSPTAACVSGTPWVAQGLFPEVYTVKVGTCAEADASQTSIDLRPVAVATPIATVPVAAVTVDVRSPLGVSLAGRTVTATHALGCSETFTLPSTTSGGTQLVLPYGTWTLSTARNLGFPPQVTSVVTANSTNKTPSVVLTVQS